MSKAPYDPVADFTPIARVGSAPMLLVMAPGKPQKTLAEAAAAAKQAPSEWTAATAALGSPGHLAMIAFGDLAGFKPTIVPYRGTAPALNDVAGGHVQLYFDAMIALLPMVQNGSIKALAITAPQRHKLAPGDSDLGRERHGRAQHPFLVCVLGTEGHAGGADAAVARSPHRDDGRARAGGQARPARHRRGGGERPQAFAKFQDDEVTRNAALLKSVDFVPN